MRTLVIRHAQAVPPQSGLPDDERALTPDGERRFASTALGIARLVPTPDALVTSPLLRARQTAALLKAAWGGIDVGIEPALASGSVDAILAVLDNHPPDASVVLVGHEPTVSMLVARLTGARDAPAFEPGAAALVDGGRLVWLLSQDAVTARTRA